MDKQSFLDRAHAADRFIRERKLQVQLSLMLGFILIAACSAPLPQDKFYASPVSNDPAPAASVSASCQYIAQDRVEESNFGPGNLVAMAGDSGGIIFASNLKEVRDAVGVKVFVCQTSGVNGDPMTQSAAEGFALIDIKGDLVLMGDN